MTKPISSSTPITVGVLALQGGVVEHLAHLRKAAAHLSSSSPQREFVFTEVRTTPELQQCDALVIPGGESTTMAIVARRLGLLEPLREFVKTQRKPVWGTCAGLVLLAEQASATKQGGQELVGGLDVRVLRNRYGTQLQSFVAALHLPFLSGCCPSSESSAEPSPPNGERDGQGRREGKGEGEGEGNNSPFRGVFIRAPVVEEIIGDGGEGAGKGGSREKVEVLGVYRREGEEGQQEGDIVAVRQGNVFGTSFHPELTDDARIHVWWLRQVVDAVRHGELVVGAS
ncbi:hypothetical protein VTK26DRAFT_8022 [Humicola hyalothermophila]